VLAAELYAGRLGFDSGFSLRHAVERMLCRKVTLRAFIDSKTLFDCFT
jgi:hypothetical protein